MNFVKSQEKYVINQNIILVQSLQDLLWEIEQRILQELTIEKILNLKSLEKIC